MRNSIRTKVFISICFLSLFFVLLSWGLNAVYLEKYYISQKKNLLKETYEKINSLYTGDIENVAINLEIIENTIGTSIIIINDKWEIQYSSFPRAAKRSPFNKKPPTNEDETSSLKKPNPLEHFLNSVNLGEKQSTFRIQKDPDLKISFLEFISILNTGELLLLRVPLVSMSESANVANQFLIFTGILLLLLGGIWAYIFSKNFTKPILELNRVAEHVANLDFSQKYIVKSDDELGTLSKSIHELSRKLDHTITELNQKNERLSKEIENERQIDKMRKEFISNVSHELKTPIALIQGYAEGLKESVIEDKENKDFYCEVIIDESNKMNKLVKDLLNLSQFESGFWELERRDFELYSLIDQILNKYQGIFEEKNVKIAVNQNNPVVVNADLIRTEQILVNYLNNALDHVDSQKKIELQIREENAKIIVSIFNSGNHIPTDSLEEIWTSFYKVDSARTREYGGYGLGLSIVKAIQELHHNKFGVENVEGGVSFWFELDKSKNL